jgi:phage terminase large subunit GpA-like protein
MIQYPKNTEKILNTIQKVWSPPPDLTVSEWSDKYRILSSESSSESGIWRTSRAPYQKAVMDTINDHKINTIVFMKSAQVGATEILNNIVAYFIDQDPSPILVLQPTLQMAQAWSKDRLANMIRDTDCLREKVKEPRSKDSSNTVLSKKFPGGNINIVGSNSAAGLASRPIRILLCDEVDRYEASAGAEGDPISLATKRTTTFWNRKVFLTSTPTIKNLSRIETAFEESDKRYYYVPCPHCQEKQILKWEQIRWEQGQPETAEYDCEHCGNVIEESSKQWMLENGEWIATEDTKKIAGFHISELYSPWRTWKEMAIDFYAVRKQPEMLRTWVNTALGKTFDDPGESIEYAGLIENKEDYDYTSIPTEILLLTCGVDVQNDRLEAQVIGWSYNNEAWVIHYKIFHGDPSSNTVWNDLDSFLQGFYTREDGKKLKIAGACVDSGGHHTQQVYAFCAKRNNRKVFAIKGQSQQQKPIAGRPSFIGRAKHVLYPVGSDTAKEAIYTRLGAELRTIHFPADVDEEYFKQLTSEKRVIKYSKGVKKFQWVKKTTRNEALDTMVYAFASLYILQPNYEKIDYLIQNNKSIQTETKISERPLIKQRSNWVKNWK